MLLTHLILVNRQVRPLKYLVHRTLMVKKVNTFFMKVEIHHLLFRNYLSPICSTEIPAPEFRKDHRVKKSILQAVQGNPPNKETGRVGAVGHIHFTCIISSKLETEVMSCIKYDFFDIFYKMERNWVNMLYHTPVERDGMT